MDPKHSTKSTEDFLLVVLSAYLVGAANKVCSEGNIEDCLQCSKEVVARFIEIKIPGSEAQNS